MLRETIVNNPLGWVQLQLLGGWRRVFMIMGVYAAAVLVGHVMIYRATYGYEGDIAGFCDEAFGFMVFIMALMLVIGGASAIKKAIHRDFTTDMITSHRNTAMGGQLAVFGYLTGATATVFGLTLVNWFTCTILAILSKSSFDCYYLGPILLLVILLAFSALAWTLGVLLGLRTRGGMNVAGLVVVIGIMAATPFLPVIHFHPGFALLVDATALQQLSNAQAAGIMDASIIISMIAQVAFALVFFQAAARKFTRDDVAAFNPILAFGLLASSALLCSVALAYWPTAITQLNERPEQVLPIMLLATLGSLALLAILPVANAAHNRTQWAKRKVKDPEFNRPRPIGVFLATLLATVIGLGICAIVWHRHIRAIMNESTGLLASDIPGLGTPVRSLLLIAVVFFLALLPVGPLLRMLYARSLRGMWFMSAFIVLLWAMPPFLDLAVSVLSAAPEDAGLSWLFACSPIGAWIVICYNAEAALLPGLLVQAGLAVMLFALDRRMRP